MGSLLEAALLERCDGNRNILYACVSRSFPTAAHHEPGEPVESQSGGTATATGALGDKLESIKSADALAAAVAAAAAAVRLQVVRLTDLLANTCIHT